MDLDSTTLLHKAALALLGLISIYTVYNACAVIYNLWFHPLAKFPGPASRAGFFATDFWHLFKGSQIRDVKALHDKYGDVVRIRPNGLTFNTAQAFKDIYGTRQGKHQLRKDPEFYTVAGMDQTHIIWSNDADHSRMRKLLAHAFSDSALRQQENIMKKYFELLVFKLQQTIDGPSQGVADLTRFYNFLTFDIIGDLCFGESFNALESGDYHIWMKNLFQGIKYSRIMRIATFYQPLMSILRAIVGLFPSIEKARREHMQFTELKTAKRLDDAKTDRKDFMTYILRYNDDRGMSRGELMETTGILIIGGSETTATLLSGATYFLLKNPRTYAAAKDEVRKAFQAAEDITLTSTAQLPYLHAILEESLRLYPPVPLALPRVTPPEGDMIDGVFVPGNTAIGVAQFATYHSSKNFIDPESFVPERWLPNPPAPYDKDNRDSLNPFSMGPRNCIGKNLAYNEMRSVMARMLWHFDMELLPESDGWVNQNVFMMWEKPPLKVKLSHRNI